jgi:hypothetical protein
MDPAKHHQQQQHKPRPPHEPEGKQQGNDGDEKHTQVTERG